MGVVYPAWDEELGVAVALKVVRSEVMADPAGAREVERRFKRELLLARQVTHKHVVRIHDLGEIGGIKYIRCPLSKGKTSRTCSSAKGGCRSAARSTSRARRRRGWPPPTRSASCTATSSRRT